MAPLSTRRSSTRRSAALLAVGIVLPLSVLAACSQGGDDEAEGTLTRPDIAATSRGRVADGGSLRWAVDALPATLNAFQADADGITQRVTGAVLPTLFTQDERGRPQRDADYLAAADLVQREPRQVVVYKLNPRAVWNDGKALSAADFEAQWKALRGRDRAYWTAHNDGYERIDRVERGADAHQVKITFAKPYADWASLFSPLYPRSVMRTPDAFNDSARNDLKVSAGPFRVGPRSNREGTLTLVRDPKWWGDRAKLDKLVLRAASRDERAESLAAGKLDVAEVSPAAAARITAAGKHREKGGEGKRTAVPPADRRLRGLVVRKSLEPFYTQLALNGASGPLADERVRRAVARAIDRDAVATSVLKPLGLPAAPLGSHVFMAGQHGYEDNSDAIGGPDPKAAQALLADAGWQERKEGTAKGASGRGTAGRKQAAAPGEGPGTEDAGRGDAGADEKGSRDSGGKAAAAPVRMKDGKRLTLRFVLPEGAGAEVLRSVGERIARQLDAVGIRTEISKVGDAGYFRDHIAAGTYDLALYSWPATAYPATDARPVFAKPQPAADGSLLVEQNYTRVGTDQIDQLFEQASTELDADASRDLVGRADARIWAAAGSIPLYQRPELVAVRPGVVNAGAFGLSSPRYQDLGFRK
ncbi:ABC transporter family substrate-binding protein [Streptomyces sp. ISL-11]|uniref:ABC transporter family substrate-binding protein n=1 Tax=Streptomyces sp. ISL-11 TaxID=2819174 RepID=UPI001BEB93BE|nr:ABC transporter family substrate-binding protein [Streptomyces sp. ISL-11]MBT2386907.1 ABC transporter family substrate-binding protein [Streptomyces sp. ISL-11]